MSNNILENETVQGRVYFDTNNKNILLDITNGETPSSSNRINFHCAEIEIEDESQSGNFISDISAENHTITVTKGTIENKDVTLSYGQESTIATIGDVDITVTMPASSGGGSSYTLLPAEPDRLGGIKIGYTTNNKNYKVQIDSSGNAYVNVPWTNANTSYFEKTNVIASKSSIDTLNPSTTKVLSEKAILDYIEDLNGDGGSY